MKLNADSSQHVIVTFKGNQWIALPMPGIDRKMLDRIGDEVARATTIVRHALTTPFPLKPMTGRGISRVGRDVLCRTPGPFRRAPMCATHRHPPPMAISLHQFDPADRTQGRGDMSDEDAYQLLHRDTFEDVRVENWQAGETVPLNAAGGMQIFNI